ncbi:GlxA family transcriptional regulator [Deinococcus aestuarii]|uniref:GlxA family transcriptional regulator n=1 Tax=Deinococcus aestuarii TaxID=2774531 RepID=UPI001C0B1BEA|nr:helix-turn-helix domain-containing protein [Deinococcus aestuarii]
MTPRPHVPISVPGHPGTRRVVFVLLPGVNLLDLGGPAQVFDVARRFGAAYDLLFCAAVPQVQSSQGLPLGPLAPFPTPRPDDLIIIPGPRLDDPVPGRPWIEPAAVVWLRAAFAAGAHLASVCTGTAALGEAGLLDGRRCTTHWGAVEAMRARYPGALVQDAVLYTHDGPITTSAGIASGIDMALSLLEREHGPLLTAQVAHYLVVYLRRDGVQTQASVYLEYRTHLHPGVHRVQDQLSQHPADRAPLNALAELANMSPRGLTRAFKQHTGLTPLAYQHELRLELAAQLMADPHLTLEVIAGRCGFDDPRHFRRLWQARHGSPPSEARTQLTAPR